MWIRNITKIKDVIKQSLHEMKLYQKCSQMDVVTRRVNILLHWKSCNGKENKKTITNAQDKFENNNRIELDRMSVK